MWEAVVAVLDKFHPEYKEENLVFWRLPPMGQWHFGEPDEARAWISPIWGALPPSLPSLALWAEHCSRKRVVDRERGEYEGICVHVKGTRYSPGGKETVVIDKQYVVYGEDAKDFVIEEERANA
jgi:hypothetical protein